MQNWQTRQGSLALHLAPTSASACWSSGWTGGRALLEAQPGGGSRAGQAPTGGATARRDVGQRRLFFPTLAIGQRTPRRVAAPREIPTCTSVVAGLASRQCRPVRGIPVRRIGRPEDLDGPLLLLASDAGRYMTGSTILVDGGFLLA
jgi:NAD(P)-dependent dehydrogenase (short-subunit alcohol dehydrogenase family)